MIDNWINLDVYELRKWLEKHFQADTASPNCQYISGSMGHCAAVAWIVRELYGGDFVSADVDRQSHWFNRDEDSEEDIDLTGDQFGKEPVRFDDAGNLWEGTRLRQENEMNEETIKRARLLAHRAGLDFIL
jgi:hypothetical protein